jgi:hypothetical protein
MKRVIFLLSLLALIFICHTNHAQDLQEIMSQMTDPARSAEYESDYKFDAYIRMEMSNAGQAGTTPEKMVYDTYVDKAGGNLAMVFTQEGMPITIILDAVNDAMVMLMEIEGHKTGMVMAVNPDAFAEIVSGYEDEPGDRDMESLRTGRTKNILGYLCDEYLMKDGSGEIHVWASEKLGKEIGQEVLNKQKVFGGAFSHAVLMSGMVMEYRFINEDNEEEMMIQVTKLDLGSTHSISTAGHQMMNMGQF